MGVPLHLQMPIPSVLFPLRRGPKWRGLLLTGNNVSGIQIMIRVLTAAGYCHDPTPRPEARIPTFAVIDTDELWDYGLVYHKVYIRGPGAPTPEHEHWSDVIIHGYDSDLMWSLAMDLAAQTKE